MNVAYIPVRGGSKSIPMKNIKLIAGKPLVYWTVKAACECADINKVYISTDNDVICDVVKKLNFSKVTVIDRSVESATDTASTEIGMLEFANNYSFDNIALIQATSPLLTSVDLNKGFEVFSRDDVDSVLSVVRQERFIWTDTDISFAVPYNYDYLKRPRRQDFNGFLVENGAFYITSRNMLTKNKCRISGNIKTVEMARETYIELDELDDWGIVESKLLERDRETLIPDIKMFLTDCDGTLTDGGMYYSSDGEVMKKFNTRDGVGLRLLKENGIITGIITGENSDIVCKRAEKLKVDEVLLGVTDKVMVIQDLCKKYGIEMNEVAYIGDDINDTEAIKNVGLGMCVGNAIPEVKKIAKIVTKALGGKGAVREASELVRNKRLK